MFTEFYVHVVKNIRGGGGGYVQLSKMSKPGEGGLGVKVMLSVSCSCSMADACFVDLC